MSMHKFKLLASSALVGVLLASSPVIAANSGSPTWQPKVSERLVKLPPAYMKKSLDRDFARSALGQAVQDIEREIGLKTQTLADLQQAIEQADGDVLIELKHQFLAEKRGYLDMMQQKQDLQRKQVSTRHRVLERLLAKLNRKAGGMSPAKQKLADQQTAARQRFNASASKVDMNLFAESDVPESKYSREYGKNLQAIQSLVAAIKSHPMNSQSALDDDISKPEYVRRMVADAEAELALIDQESQILGFMAKIVALDAMVLSEEIADSDYADSDITEPTDITSVVNLFVNN
ncbi:MAG: hypothetical protein HOE62_04440 [Alphaproteobacteria bacterium]|nr:hypothetical protein [Alphaproteobacteria bacterium]MBT4966258.1 hypothetical protein [Alphaproteobacteria bacterium]MBT5159179.1 hypothetical protein [Alphaproteobacteria bacterium]MBT5917104.1 hypothetical protein [Alphaproteobacteria bacterium]